MTDSATSVSNAGTWDQLWDLTGRVALVTGGGTGIGLMIAHGLAGRGAKVYIAGRRVDVLEKAAQPEGVYQGSGRLIPIKMDVTDKVSISSVVDKIKTDDGKLDILVNNAASDGPKDRSSYTSAPPPEPTTMAGYGKKWYEALSFADWGNLAQVNVASVFFVTMAFLELLEESTKREHAGRKYTASVINISSAGPHMNMSFGYYPYHVLKAGTVHLTEILATEFSLRKAPIRVNGIAPGLFPSELAGTEESLIEFMSRDQAKESGGKAGAGANSIPVPTPMGRPGRAQEMAALAVYLASPASEYTHGQEIIIDGGLVTVNP